MSAKGTINKRSDVISAVDNTAQQFKEMNANCIYQLITLQLRRIKKHSRHQVLLFVLKRTYNTLTWTLILTSRNSTPEYLTGSGELFSEVDRNVVCCDYDRTIFDGSYYYVVLFQMFHFSR